MDTFPGKLLVFALCGALIFWQQRRGYFARLAPFLRQHNMPGFVSILGVAAIAASMILLIDPSLAAAVQGIRASAVLRLIRFGGWLGQGTALWAILLSLYAAALVFRRFEGEAAVFGCIISAALASVFSSAFKWSVARARPNANLGHLAFFRWPEALRNHSRFQSFPSGDTVIVAAVAWYLFYRCRKAPLGARLMLFILPLATACSRVLLNKHWPSDTVFSFGLGLASAYCVVRYESFRGNFAAEKSAGHECSR